jgi:hypothetical protein
MAISIPVSIIHTNYPYSHQREMKKSQARLPIIPTEQCRARAYQYPACLCARPARALEFSLPAQHGHYNLSSSLLPHPFLPPTSSSSSSSSLPLSLIHGGFFLVPSFPTYCFFLWTLLRRSFFLLNPFLYVYIQATSNKDAFHFSTAHYNIPPSLSLLQLLRLRTLLLLLRLLLFSISERSSPKYNHLLPTYRAPRVSISAPPPPPALNP